MPNKDATTYLSDTTIGTFEASLDAHGGLVGELDGGLQEVDGELGVGLCGQPQAESVVYVLCSQYLHGGGEKRHVKVCDVCGILATVEKLVTSTEVYLIMFIM